MDNINTSRYAVTVCIYKRFMSPNYLFITIIYDARSLFSTIITNKVCQINDM